MLKVNNEMSKVLLEIFCEEMPALMQLECLEKFTEIIRTTLDTSSSIDGLVSPRHLCVIINNYIINNKIFVKGPKITAPEGAIKGFMNKYNILNINELKEKDGILILERSLSQEECLDELSKNISIAIGKMVWPKSMLWNQHNIKWIRPIHAITCVLDDKVLNINFGHINSGNITYGHRSQGSPKIEIKSADSIEYQNLLRKNGVIVSHEERKKIILNQIDDIIKSMNLKLLDDESLLNEVVGLVENPFVFLGNINNSFMSLPTEVLITSLKNHQKYLLLKDQNDNLAPYFIIVSDICSDDNGITIINGNEKVLAARLSDAQHFIKTDLKTSFKNFSEKLHKIQFHKDIGSIYEKVIRIQNIAKTICHQIKIDSKDSEEASKICKNDLVTQMVGEFPELQGIIGYYYAIEGGYNKDIAMAVRDHYKPCGPNDSLPETLVGCVVAISDKLDTLQSLFNIGIKPTSTKDPYALRRAAIGIIRIISTHEKLMKNLNIPTLGISKDVIEFMLERAKQMFKEYPEKYDEIVKVCM